MLQDTSVGPSRREPSWTLEAAPQSGMWTLEVDDDAEDAAEDHRSDWLAVAAP